MAASGPLPGDPIGRHIALFTGLRADVLGGHAKHALWTAGPTARHAQSSFDDAQRAFDRTCLRLSASHQMPGPAALPRSRPRPAGGTLPEALRSIASHRL